MKWCIALLLCAASVSPVVLGDVALEVRETAGVARSGEVLSSGIPLPRALNVRSTNALAVLDPSGAAIPAEFRVLARWNAGRADASAPIQWLLVSFAASVPANGAAAYRLLTDSSRANPAPATPLRVERAGNRITVDTGAATFTINATSLFEEIRRDGVPLVRAGANDGSTLRAMTIEHAGPLTAIIQLLSVSQLATRKRYVFTAGSATAIVRQSVAWEGTNAVRVDPVRNTLSLAMPSPRDVLVAGARDAYTLHATANTAHVHQQLRASRTAPPRYDAAAGGGTLSGAKADGALLAAGGAEGTIAIALDHMHRYEPQALLLVDASTLAIDLAAEPTWLGARQAMFATFAIGAAPPNASHAQLQRDVWAPLNHPLRAWPGGAWFSASGAVDPVPPRALPSQFAGYDAAMRQVLERTVKATDDLGVHGLMSFGLFPRAWGDPLLADEVQCFGDDPTPSDPSDDLYWCATWTDYHNASSNAAAHAMRTGEVQWLDEIARPAALRQLFTQIYQCSPDDDYFYCGQAPAGYGGYRADFNSSHAYFDNLFLHYWLTGDATVVETLQRGASSMRNYVCMRRPASACGAHDPPVDEWAGLTGRVASQWNLAFRFVGLASGDASYLDDWRNNMARAFTQQYVVADDHGFLFAGWQPIAGAGTRTTDQLWMSALYDLKNLETLRRDTNDAPIGDPPLRPSAIISAFARTLERYGPAIDGDWPNQLDVIWSGPRVGGTIVSVRAHPGGGDPLLYDTGKATLAGPLANAAALTGDPALRALAHDAIQLAIRASLASRAPLGKIQAEYLARLHAAIAMLSPQKRRAVR